MTLTIQTIRSQPTFSTLVNCYLVHVDAGFVLIDTGHQRRRERIEMALDEAGVQPGNLNLIILTTGDFDHSGNAAYFRQRYCADVTMHVDDTLMVERGDVYWNRRGPNFMRRTVTQLILRLSKADRFRPDFYVKDGEDLSLYGFPATVVQLPGHSRGSLGILSAEGDLFCGDLLVNHQRPAVKSNMDDPVAAQASVKKVKRLGVNKVYPGHGRPFLMLQFLQQHAASQPATSRETTHLVLP